MSKERSPRPLLPNHSKKTETLNKLTKTNTFTVRTSQYLPCQRLRHNHTQSDLVCHFNVEQSSVSCILNHWIPFLSAQFKRLIRWPQTCVGPSVAPYDLLANSVTIIDGIEIFIQRPSNLATQKSAYSDCKSHTTAKYLVAIDTFTGVIVFVSAGFSGNSSDRFTIEHSGILKELKPGQKILADKGYNAQDLFAQKRVEMDAATHMCNKCPFRACVQFRWSFSQSKTI